MAELWWNLTMSIYHNLSIHIHPISPGFSYQFLGGPGFWPSGRTLHDFLGHIFLSKLHVFGCTWPNFTHYQLQGVVTHGHGTPLEGFFHQAFRISWIQNWLKSVALFWIHPSGTYWCIWCIKFKNDLMLYNIYIYMICIMSEAFVDTATCFKKKNSAKSGAELGGCIKPYEILAWQWLWGNVLTYCRSTVSCAANQVWKMQQTSTQTFSELSRTVIQHCKATQKNDDISSGEVGLTMMCPNCLQHFF